ncbi:glycosyltransferase family 2 protein [Polynucleobacter paneuropaeus]|nr:glycosyltransferase family 2 protein [Polynucleobacter paneuropaeus]
MNPNTRAKSPLITIAIPTYNRLEILSNTLALLAKQDGFYDDDVEIVISDNCSPIDPTPMLREFEKSHGRPVVIHRNIANEGIDGNIHRVADLASGYYILFMSDDDILLPGTLRRMKILVRENPDLLFCFMNCYPFRECFDPLKMVPPIIKIDQTLVTQSNDRFVETIGIWSTFVSAFFVERLAWINIQDRTRFIGTDIYLTHVLFRLLSEGSQRIKVVTAEPLIAARDAFTGSFRIAHAFGFNFMRLLLEDAPLLGFSKRTMRAIKLNVMHKSLPTMILMIRLGPQPRALIFQEFQLLLRYTWWEPVAWLRMLPLMILPISTLRILGRLRRTLRSHIFKGE